MAARMAVVTILRYLRRFLVIYGHPQLSLAILDQPSSPTRSLAILRYLELFSAFIAIRSCLWLPLAILRYPQQSLAVPSYRWPSFAILSYSWLSMAVPGYLLGYRSISMTIPSNPRLFWAILGSPRYS